MENLIKRGQVRYAMLEPVLGSEQGGRRPVIVVSNDMGNRHGPTVVVVPVTTGPKPLLPTHVRVGVFLSIMKFHEWHREVSARAL